MIATVNPATGEIVARFDTLSETELDEKQATLGDPKVMADHVKMGEAGRAVAVAQTAVDALYRRWEELENKRGA